MAKSKKAQKKSAPRKKQPLNGIDTLTPGIDGPRPSPGPLDAAAQAVHGPTWWSKATEAERAEVRRALLYAFGHPGAVRPSSELLAKACAVITEHFPRSHPPVLTEAEIRAGMAEVQPQLAEARQRVAELEGQLAAAVRKVRGLEQVLSVGEQELDAAVNRRTA